MLRIERLQVSYGETQILRDVDLEVGPGHGLFKIQDIESPGGTRGLFLGGR